MAESECNVVEFTPKREYVWEHRCAGFSQTFFLHRDGSVQCQGCKEFVDEICWGKRNQSETPA